MLLDSVLQNLDIVKLLETQTNKKVLIFAPPLSRKTIHLMMHFSECSIQLHDNKTVAYKKKTLVHLHISDPNIPLRFISGAQYQKRSFHITCIRRYNGRYFLYRCHIKRHFTTIHKSSFSGWSQIYSR